MAMTTLQLAGLGAVGKNKPSFKIMLTKSLLKMLTKSCTVQDSDINYFKGHKLQILTHIVMVEHTLLLLQVETVIAISLDRRRCTCRRWCAGRRYTKSRRRGLGGRGRAWSQVSF